jgi:hypothetical protein
MTARPYYGPVEALTMEQAASRLGIGIDLFRKRYTGRVLRIGANVRIAAADLHEWLDGLGGNNVNANPWDTVVGDAEEGALSKGQQGQVA